MTYSNDLRKKALDYIENGGSKVKASEIFGVTVQTLILWSKRKHLGNLAPNPTRKKKPQKLDSASLKAFIKRHPDRYLREIAEEFGVTLSAVFYACKRLKITLKKRCPSIKKGMKRKEKNFARS